MAIEMAGGVAIISLTHCRPGTEHFCLLGSGGARNVYYYSHAQN